MSEVRDDDKDINVLSKFEDTISRQAAIDALDCIKCTEEVLRSLPSAQPAVEVVRCKECKHYQFADNRAFGMPVKMCEWFGFEDVEDDDFCSRAERKDDE